MAAQSFKFGLNWLVLSYRKRQKSGFTLTELLVTILIAGIIITGLLSLVVEMLGKDYKEAARSETQREMQTALEFMSNEMREAAYIYDGDCLDAGGTTGVGCAGIFKTSNYIPIPTNSVPIIAFWKLDPIPQNCPANLPQCTNNRLAGRTYTLVVYYLSKDNPNNVWKGKARILRYESAQFSTNGNSVTAAPGYVEPFENNETNPRRWPLKPDGSSFPRNGFSGDTVALTDFVDLPEPGETPPTITCDTGAVKTPNDNTLNQYGFAGVRTFYACVRVSATSTGQNQKAILFLKGNAWGKSGITSKEEALPTLETQVTNRGVVDKLGEQ